MSVVIAAAFSALNSMQDSNKCSISVGFPLNETMLMYRALGEYAEQNGATADGSGLVTGFFKALEAFDLRLFEAGRFSRPVADGTDKILDDAVKALDRRVPCIRSHM